MYAFIFGGTTGWVGERTKDAEGRLKGCGGEWLRTGLSAADYFLNALADPPGQRNGVTEMPQSSGVHMDGGLG